MTIPYFAVASAQHVLATRQQASSARPSGCAKLVVDPIVGDMISCADLAIRERDAGAHYNRLEYQRLAYPIEAQRSLRSVPPCSAARRCSEVGPLSAFAQVRPTAPFTPRVDGNQH